MIRATSIILAAAVAGACATTPKTGGTYTAMTAAARLTAPLLDHKLTAPQITERIAQLETACDATLQAVVALPDASRTFHNTPDAVEQALATFWDGAYRLGILKDVHPDPAVREAAAGAEERAGQYAVKVASRRDLYKAMKAWSEGPGKAETLDPQERRLVEIVLRDFRRNGLELDDAGLARLVEIRSKLTSLSTEFQKHLNENTASITISEAELAGLPPTFVQRLKKNDAGAYIVTTKYPDYFPLMENAKSGDARRRMYVAFNTREATTNIPILEEAVKLRDEAAHLLGYATHADYITEDRMARTGARVKDFLASLRSKMAPRRDADYAKLLEIKRSQTGDAKATLEPSDILYLLNELKKRDYTLDDEEIREYFPSDRVVAGMFGVYEELLSIRIVQVPGADVWHPDVKLYEIRDRDSGALLAHFYADLYPRDGKYGHAACAPLNAPRETPGGYVEPIALIMANFNPPSGDRPSLLSHDEVKTLFHEFGHVMHQTLTQARFASQAGFNVAGDFVEAPSQMLENWVYAPEVLDRIGGHYKDPSKKLSREIIARIAAARMYDAGYRYTRQVFLASFDQAIHTSGPKVDVGAVEHRTFSEILALELPKEVRFSASFGHMMGGYDAGYYGYLWSEVFAADMFTLFKRDGVLSGPLGRKYRDVILAKGRSVEPEALLEEFLGRKPGDDAFFEKLGIQ